MKENSIERDIHLLESYAGMTHKMNDNQGRPKLDQAIEHILSEYKKVLKENEELKEKIREQTLLISPYYVKENYIPIQKVKDKIEELDKEEKRELKGTKGQDRYYIKQKYMYKRKVLEELLREE